MDAQLAFGYWQLLTPKAGDERGPGTGSGHDCWVCVLCVTWSMRCRASSLPRDVWRSTALDPPASRICSRDRSGNSRRSRSTGQECMCAAVGTLHCINHMSIHPALAGAC